jgi:hypothetical protein
MSSNAWPISVPAVVLDTGDFVFQHDGNVNIIPNGDIIISTGGGMVDFQNGSINNFVTTTKGDLIYADEGGVLARLGLGTNGQFLTVVGDVPGWATLASQGPLFSAFGTGAAATFAASTSWQDLDAGHALWDVSVSGGVSDAAFTLSSGVFTANATGVYEICAGMAWTPNNGGNAVTLTSPPGRAARQIRVVNGAGTTVYSVASVQAEANNLHRTEVKIANCKIALNNGDTIKLQARHDSNTSLGAVGTDRQTYLSVSRVR